MTESTTEPISISNNQTQLFVDDYLVAESQSVHRRINRPHKHGTPILVPDQPWEMTANVYGQVLEMGNELWLFYKALGHWSLSEAEHREKFGFGPWSICIARSKDGVHFEKTPIEDSPIPGSNVILQDSIDDFCIRRDDQDPDPNRRYKMLTSRRTWMNGLTNGISPDGIHWTFLKEYAVPYLGDRMSYWYDEPRGKHIAWSRDYHAHPKRWIWQVETDDFNQWDDSRENHPWLAMQPERLDHPDVQLYGGYAFWYQSMYLAYVEVYYVHEQRIDTQLACSRDGRNWQRLCNHEPFLRGGEHGEFDGYWIVPTFNPPIHRDGKLLIHYSGRPDPHKAPGFAHIQPGMNGSHGLAALREDGFVSLDATGNEGAVTTPLLALQPDARAIEVNICPFNTWRGKQAMTLAVDVLNHAGEIIATHQVDVSDSSAIRYAIQCDKALPEHARLRFRYVNGRLYGFRLTGEAS